MRLVLLALALLGLTLGLALGPFTLVVAGHGDGVVAYRLNRWTGAIVRCEGAACYTPARIVVP